MLKRAAHFLLVALVAGIFGFTGILHWTAAIAQSVCVFCVALAVLSLLFSLFEEPTVRTRKLRVDSGSHPPPAIAR